MASKNLRRAVRPTGDFADRVVRPQIDLVVAAVGVGVKITLEPPQEARRPVAGATFREVVDGVGMFVGDVGPEAARAAAFLSRPTSSVTGVSSVHSTGDWSSNSFCRS